MSKLRRTFLRASKSLPAVRAELNNGLNSPIRLNGAIFYEGVSFLHPRKQSADEESNF